ncbi:MAG: polyphosphate kinase 2 family protein [Methanomicrobiales archaeon]
MDIKGPQLKKYLNKFVVEPEKKVRLKNYDPGWAQNDTLKQMSEDAAQGLLEKMLVKDRAQLDEVQALLAASHQHSVLIVLQGMDTAGKDGTIRHVMSGVNPQGCEVHGFKVPSAEEHAHDFLWRYYKVLPERGMIGIFNRSYYEDVLVVRVHPERMEELPKKLGPDSGGFWSGRYKDINAFEKHLVQNGTIILKFFLHISKDEQKRRLLARLEDKEKYWKFSTADLAEREYWNKYVGAYEEMLSATSTEYAPWFIVPADYKWVARTLVAEVITSSISGLKLSYPKVSDEQVKALMDAKQKLEAE